MDKELHTMAGNKGMPFSFRGKTRFLKGLNDLSLTDISDLFEAKKEKAFREAAPVLSRLSEDAQTKFLTDLHEKTTPDNLDVNDKATESELSAFIHSADIEGMAFFLWVSLRGSMDEFDNFNDFRNSLTLDELKGLGPVAKAARPPEKKRKARDKKAKK